jgi:hypothetical protein
MADDSKAGLLVHLLHRAGQRAEGLFALEIGELGLTPRQFAVLQAVSAANGPSQTDRHYGRDGYRQHRRSGSSSRHQRMFEAARQQGGLPRLRCPPHIKGPAAARTSGAGSYCVRPCTFVLDT